MTQRSILITGCSSGLGYDAAHALHKAGWQVLATCRAEADCARLRAEGLTSFVLDINDPASIRAGLNQTLEHTGGTLDALYNNAAFALPAPVEDLPADALRAVFETNLFGLHDLTRQVIPVMRAQGHGRIVNCSSVLGFVPLKWRGAYVSSKYALEGLTDVLRLEMADTGIHVTLLEPGPIATKIRENSIPHFERWIDWQSSARKAQYEDSLLDALYKGSGGNRFELHPAANTAKLIRILNAKRPPARVFVTTPTYLMNAARRLLSTRMLDWLVGRG